VTADQWARVEWSTNGVGTLVRTRALDAAMAMAREARHGKSLSCAAANHFRSGRGSVCFLAAATGFRRIIGSMPQTTMAPTGGRDVARLVNSPGRCFGVAANPAAGGDPR